MFATTVHVGQQLKKEEEASLLLLFEKINWKILSNYEIEACK
jgi:hypothetical protein